MGRLASHHCSPRSRQYLKIYCRALDAPTMVSVRVAFSPKEARIACVFAYVCEYDRNTHVRILVVIASHDVRQL